MLTIRKWSPGGSFETGAGAAARAVALGIFDGVHLGHRAVISKATGVETPEGMLRAAVFTFSQSPWALPKDSAWELLSPAQKIKALESLGVEEMLLADFEQIRDMSPRRLWRRSSTPRSTPNGCAAASITGSGKTGRATRPCSPDCAGKGASKR